MSTLEIKVIKKRSEIREPIKPPCLETERISCRDLLSTMIKGLVDYPETVSVDYTVGEKTTIFNVQCSQKCMGQVIGSKGRNISSVRSVIAAVMARKGIRAIVEIPYFAPTEN